jgi:hypothetical protein
MASAEIRIDKVLVVAMLAMTVGSCSLFDAQTAQRSTPTASAPLPATLPPSRPAPTPDARTARLPAPAVARPRVSGDVEVTVVGLSQAEAEAVLGPPAREMDQPPAKVWQYRSGDCGLNVYFYLDVARNAFYALHYDAGAPPTSPIPAAAGDAADRCLRRIYNDRRQSR